MTDDPGVMGNLPRSRPGRRSAKRASEVKPPSGSSGAKKAAAKSRSAGTKARASTGAGAKARASTGARAGGAKAGASTRAKAGGSTGAKAGGSTRSKAGASSGASARAASGAKSAARGAARGAAAERDTAPRTAVRDERVEEQSGQDPITAALKLGMAVGDAGVKAVAKIVQRLPRP